MTRVISSSLVLNIFLFLVVIRNFCWGAEIDEMTVIRRHQDVRKEALLKSNVDDKVKGWKHHDEVSDHKHEAVIKGERLGLEKDTTHRGHQGRVDSGDNNKHHHVLRGAVNYEMGDKHQINAELIAAKDEIRPAIPGKNGDIKEHGLYIALEKCSSKIDECFCDFGSLSNGPIFCNAASISSKSFPYPDFPKRNCRDTIKAIEQENVNNYIKKIDRVRKDSNVLKNLFRDSFKGKLYSFHNKGEERKDKKNDGLKLESYSQCDEFRDHFHYEGLGLPDREGVSETGVIFKCDESSHAIFKNELKPPTDYSFGDDKDTFASSRKKRKAGDSLDKIEEGSCEYYFLKGGGSELYKLARELFVK